MKKYAGMAAALLSAFLFGSTAILAKLTYSMGSNPVMLVFLRAGFALPVLLALVKAKRVPLALTKREARDVLLVGLLGFAPTGLLLYGSYQYIAVGLATVLHFLFPVVVTLAGLLFFKSKLSPAKLVALVLGMAGVVLFFDGADRAGAAGLALALASAFTYSFYMLGVEHTTLRHLYHFKLTFYLSLCSMVVSGVFALCTGNMTFAISPLGWVYTILVSLLVSVVAFTLFQVAIRLSGATTTAILSTLEPITGVVLGVVVLGEALSPMKVAGCVSIIAGVLVITITGAKQGGK